MNRYDIQRQNELTVMRTLQKMDEPLHARRLLFLLPKDTLAESSVYVVLKRLVKNGLLLSRVGARDYKGHARPLYSLSANGRRRLEA
jgi:predicted transcriptional regulator